MNILLSYINPEMSPEKPAGIKDEFLPEKCLPQMDLMTGFYLIKHRQGYDELNRLLSDTRSPLDIPYF
jgi:hypothetical protein